MSIPADFVAPALPVSIAEYDQRSQDKFNNVLRLYFNLLDNHNTVINSQVSSNQTLIWLNM